MLRKNKFISILTSLFCLFVILSSSPVLALEVNDDQEGEEVVESGSGVEFQNVDNVGITIDDKLTLKDGTPVKEVFNSTEDMINLLVKVIFIAAGSVLFFMIIGAGLAMIGGSGGDKEKSKTTMTSALVGFVVMFAAYWIMQIIQLLTGTTLGF